MARTPKVVEDRRQQILDAAMHVFAQKGFVRATNKDIAREAAITPGLIYHYFTNKEALLRAIIEERSPLHLVRSLSPELLALPPETFLRFLLQRVLATIESEQFVQLLRVILPEIIHNPEMAPIGGDLMRQIVEAFGHYFQIKMESGDLRSLDALQVAQTLLGCVMGFVLRRQILRDPLALQYTHEQIADAIISTILYGVLSHTSG